MELIKGGAVMSKGLEALKEYKSQQLGVNVYADDYLEIIEKELKALEIINKKNVQITLLKNTNDFETYNRMLGATFYKRDIKKMSLTEEEHTCVKDVLL